MMTQNSKDDWISDLIDQSAQDGGHVPDMSPEVLDRMTRAAFDAQDALRAIQTVVPVSFWQELRAIFWAPVPALSTAAAAGFGVWLALIPSADYAVLSAPLTMIGVPQAQQTLDILDTSTALSAIDALSLETQP
ncbi:MAG: hypothetical protein ABF310_02190 [Paracoccaceae bacterium]|jgi:hypothetical protein